MAARINPFTLGSGRVPPVMAGYGNAIESIEDAFRNGPGDPNLTGIFDGACGTGKTALLTLPADAAEERGWIAARVSAVPGTLEDILVQAGKGRSDDVSRARISSIGTREAGTLGQEEDGRNWRSRLESLLDALEASGTGLLIMVDDVRDFDEMVQLASVHQHLVSAGRRISLLMAGLPSEVSRILNDQPISFLRRAICYRLGRIDDADMQKALAGTIESGGRTIEAYALEAAMKALGGFPFMMQPVGYRMRTQAEGDAIDLSAAERGIETEQQEMRMNILETTHQELSDMDIAFIEAMLPDEGPSSTAEIARCMGKARPMPPDTAGACLRRASSACPDAERQASSCQGGGHS
ncbi:ATP-binding protein [Olsenella sp. YH-ols2221]|uniref:ATP-binding protein n=1 Tax=Olsenella kribbiana TaxID=3115221 RepID=UPI002EDAB6DB